MNKLYKYILALICLFLLLPDSIGQQRFKFEQGSFVFSFKANTTGSTSSIGTDFTTKNLAALEFLDVENPQITVTISNLKWEPGFENYSLVIKKTWVVHSSGLRKMDAIDRLLINDKELAQIRFQVLADGKEEITLQFGIKPPKQNLKKVKPRKDLILQHRFNTYGVHRKSERKSEDDQINENKIPKKDGVIKDNKTPENSIFDNRNDDFAWRNAQQANSRYAIENYIRNYPNGKYSHLARRFLNNLDNEERGSAGVEPVEIGINSSGSEGLDMVDTNTVAALNSWPQTLVANTFYAYYTYMKEQPEGKFIEVARDSIVNKPILWDKKSQEEKSNGDYQFVLEFADVGLIDYSTVEKSNSLHIEILDSATNRIQITIKDSKSHQCSFKDEFGREVIVQLNPNYKMLNAILEDKGDVITYKIVGGLIPYYINFVKEGSDYKQCIQRIKKNGELIKSEWASNCDLSGKYRIEISDATKNEIKRYPGFEFVDTSFNMLKYMWIVFVPILLVLIWFVRKRV